LCIHPFVLKLLQPDIETPLHGFGQLSGQPNLIFNSSAIMTPAMEAKLADHTWSVEELLSIFQT
jgi:hypothetical protein